MEWLTTRPIAHRGLHGEGRPENSLSAFEAAIEARYPIECDVRLTADGVPVVFHDETLGRLTGTEGAVADSRFEELRTLTLDGTDQQVPRLADVLALVDGAVPLLVELKPGDRSDSLESAVTALLDDYDGPFAVQSFDPRTVAWFRRQRPAWPRGQLSCFFERPDVQTSRLRRFLCKRLWTNWYARPDFVGYDHERLPYRPVQRWRNRGTPVLAWTVRTTGDHDRVQAHADNVIFEDIRP